jgi:hypothetical protein
MIYNNKHYYSIQKFIKHLDLDKHLTENKIRIELEEHWNLPLLQVGSVLDYYYINKKLKEMDNEKIS